MRNFFLFCLALILVLIEGGIAHFYVPPGLSATEDIGKGKVAGLISVEPTASNAVEVDGVRFETAIAERVCLIPENKPGVATYVQLGISITNNRSNPLYFSFYSDMLPDLVRSDGQSLLADGAFEGISYPIESDFLLVMPGERVTYFREAKLFWANNQLLFGSHNSRLNLRRLGTWVYQDIKPGSYYVRFKYNNRESEATYYKPETKQSTSLQGIWTGQVTTPFVEISLIKP